MIETRHDRLKGRKLRVDLERPAVSLQGSRFVIRGHEDMAESGPSAEMARFKLQGPMQVGHGSDRVVLALECLGGPIEEKIGRIRAGARQAPFDQRSDSFGFYLAFGLGQTFE